MEGLLGALLGSFRGLCASKHGSNVAERVILCLSQSGLDALHASLSHGATLRELLGLSYGAYVLRALVTRLPPRARTAMVQAAYEAAPHQKGALGRTFANLAAASAHLDHLHAQVPLQRQRLLERQPHPL